MKKAKTKNTILIIIVCIVIIGCVGLFFLGNKQEKNKTSDDPKEVAKETTKEAEKIQINPKDIPGFISSDEGTICGIELPYQIPDTELIIEGIGQYSGEFVEDGSGEPVSNVMSLVIRNNSPEFVEYAEVVFTVNDSEQASFKITGIPANKYVLVMESNKREFNSEDSMIFETQLYSENKDVSLKEDMIKISTANGELTAENISEKSFDAVYIRYKTQILPDCYLGGITYNCTVEELAEGKEKNVETGHFSDKSSEIVMVETVE